MGQCHNNYRKYNISKIVPMNIKNEECCICLEPLLMYKLRINCGHEFHTHCLMRHKYSCRKYDRNYTCPLCRKKI